MQQTLREAAVARAESAIELSRSLDEGKRAPGSAGVLIAEGDSWFAYPGTNLIKELRRLGFHIATNAANGSHLEEMAFSIDRLADLHARMRQARADWEARPRALLLSGGGNDIVDDALRLILNHAATDRPPFDPQIATGLIDVRLADAICSWVIAVQQLVTDVYGSGAPVPVVMHGYDYGVPDGRGYKKVLVTWKGPWMEPAYSARGYEDLAQTAALTRDLIDRYNRLLSRLSSDEAALNLRYVDLRGRLPSYPGDYKESWDNELHPEKGAFRILATVLAGSIP